MCTCTFKTIKHEQPPGGSGEFIAALDVSWSKDTAGAGAAAGRPVALNTRQHSEHAGPSGLKGHRSDALMDAGASVHPHPGAGR